MKLRSIPLLLFLASTLLALPLPAETRKSAAQRSAQADEEESDSPAKRKGAANSKPAAADDEEGEKKTGKSRKSVPGKSKATPSEAEEDETKASATKAVTKRTKSSTSAEDENAAPAAKKRGTKSEPEEDEGPGAMEKHEGTSAHKKRLEEEQTPAKHKADVPEAVAPGTEEKTTPATPPVKPGGTGAPPAFIESTDLKGFSEQPEKVRTLIESALALAHQGLTYKFGSDDPAQGGMDCSGSVAYLLREQGCKDVPRDASGQYAWARKNGQFFAVVSKKEGGFEFSDLKPGDLLFWSGTYVVNRDPPVTHSMIYLGEHKGRKQRVMWGSSDGRTYDGKSRFGVGVFDFKMPKVGGEGEGASAAGKSPDFLGYARIPGLRGEESKGTAKEDSAEPTVKKAEKETTSKKKVAEEEGDEAVASKSSKGKKGLPGRRKPEQ